MKILVDREDLEILFLATDNVDSALSIHNKLKQILTDSPVVTDWVVAGDNTDLNQAEINNLIEITDDIRDIASRVEAICYIKKRVLYGKPAGVRNENIS
jgi:hypothetical protein